MTFLFYGTIVLFLLVCGVLSLVVLLQESKSMGLGASFGGDSGDSLFGTSTADVLKKVTGYLAVIFMVACIVLSIWSTGIAKPKISIPAAIEQANTQ